MTILTEFMLYINVIVTMSSVAQNILPLFQNRSYSFKYFTLVFIFSKLFWKDLYHNLINNNEKNINVTNEIHVIDSLLKKKIH